MHLKEPKHLKKTPLQLFLLLLLSTSKPSSPRPESIVTVTAKNGTKIIHSRTFKTQRTSPFDSTAPPFTVESDVPVSLIRYRATTRAETSSGFLSNDEVKVYVTTNCPVAFGGTVVKMKGRKDELGFVTGIKIRKKGEVVQRLLGDCEYGVSWNVDRPWCGRRTTPVPTKRVRSKPVDDDENENNINEDVEEAEPCFVTAEILFDGCFRSVRTKSKLLKVSDATFNTSLPSEIEGDDCKVNYRGNLTIKEVLFDDSSNGTVVTDKLDRRACMIVAPGRPYVDSDGTKLQSYATTATDACWSQTTATTTTSNPSTKQNTPLQQSSTASDWIERSLGEHASVASFAAFTISLMTNDAPPDLIRDALRAALDEVDHATASFEIASLLTGKTIEPGPLPSSTHVFERDLGALVESTFREGCVDETLSALAAAVEAGRYVGCEDIIGGGDEGDDCVVEGTLKEKLGKIALDEGRHAVLAWRTVGWACGSVDNAVSCDEKLDAYSSELEKAPEGAFPSLHEEFRSEWKTIYETLLPFVTGAAARGDECDTYDSAFKRSDGGLYSGYLLEEVRDRVIRGVICGGNNNVVDGDVHSTATVF